jgi:hypothetical protein
VSEVRRTRGTTAITEALPADPPGGDASDWHAHSPRVAGVVWALLFFNTLGSAAGQIIPFPRSVAQMATMGALVTAFGLALLANRRVCVRPSAYLLLLSLLVVASIASSIRLESGLGSLFRCFRLTVFVATLWLISTSWRGDFRFARYHVLALGGVLLTVLAGLVISPGAAFSGPDGRLVGAIWPIPAPQVGQYCAIGAGLAVMLWLTRHIDGRSAAVIAVPAIGLLLLSHTRTALTGLVAALAVAVLSLAFTEGRARRFLATVGGFGVVIAVAFGHIVQNWLTRGQDAEQLANLTGRQKVWDQLLAQERTLSDKVFGVGLTDRSFHGLPIDNSWLSIYNDQGWVGIVIVAAILAGLLATVALRPSSPARACAVFLILYCTVASYTEAGLGDASPYLLHLAVAASLLVHRGGEEKPTGTWPQGSAA